MTSHKRNTDDVGDESACVLQASMQITVRWLLTAVGFSSIMCSSVKNKLSEIRRSNKLLCSQVSVAHY